MKPMILRNLTSHPVRIIKGYERDGSPIFQTIPVCDTRVFTNLPRMEIIRTMVDHIDGVPIYSSRLGQVFSLPETQEHVFLIVPMVVAMACPDRQDLLFPDKIKRRPTGEIIGCYGLSRIERDVCIEQ
jgi:hypothetical protein